MLKLFGAFAASMATLGLVFCAVQIVTSDWGNQLLSAGRYIVLIGVFCCIAYVLLIRRNHGDSDDRPDGLGNGPV